MALDGRGYYLTQYFEYKENGVYQKYRLVVINGEVFIRHFRTTDHWMIHRNSCEKFMENNPQYEEKEAHILKNFEYDLKAQVQPVITEIHKRIPIRLFWH